METVANGHGRSCFYKPHQLSKMTSYYAVPGIYYLDDLRRPAFKKGEWKWKPSGSRCTTSKTQELMRRTCLLSGQPDTI
jgi:hypothetical protein